MICRSPLLFSVTNRLGWLLTQINKLWVTEIDNYWILYSLIWLKQLALSCHLFSPTLTWYEGFLGSLSLLSWASWHFGIFMVSDYYYCHLYQCGVTFQWWRLFRCGPRNFDWTVGLRLIGRLWWDGGVWLIGWLRGIGDSDGLDDCGVSEGCDELED